MPRLQAYAVCRAEEQSQLKCLWGCTLASVNQKVGNIQIVQNRAHQCRYYDLTGNMPQVINTSSGQVPGNNSQHRPGSMKGTKA